MNDLRLTFSTSTVLTVPTNVFEILKKDAMHFGFFKNKKPNLSGFLNELIPALSDYQEDFYKSLLKYNNGNAELAKAVARSIQNVHMSPLLFYNDGKEKISFRISKDKYDDFILIHDKRLSFYDTDFTNYNKTLLVEYAFRDLAQRECLFFYRALKKLKEATLKSNVCSFYNGNQYGSFVPISIKISPASGQNYIVGITSDRQPLVMKLCSLRKFVVLDEKINITDKLYSSANDVLEETYAKEERHIFAT